MCKCTHIIYILSIYSYMFICIKTNIARKLRSCAVVVGKTVNTYTYTCFYVSIFKYKHKRQYIYIRIYMCEYLYVWYVCTYVYICTYICIYIAHTGSSHAVLGENDRIYLYMHMYPYILKYISIYIYKYIYIYTFFAHRGSGRADVGENNRSACAVGWTRSCQSGRKSHFMGES